MKKILTASLVAIMAVTAANAEIASTQYVTTKTGDLNFADAKVVESGANLTAAVMALDGKLGALAGDGNESVESQIGSAIQGLTSNVNGTGVVTEISQANGIVTAKLEKIGDDQVDAISQSKITNLTDDLGKRQLTANLLKTNEDGAVVAPAEGTENDMYPSYAAAVQIAANATESLTTGFGNVTGTIGATSTETFKEQLQGTVNLETATTVVQSVKMLDKAIDDVVKGGLDDNSVEGKAIKNGTITETQLNASVNESLDLADSALQKADIATGTTNGTIKFEDKEVAVAGLGTAAYKADTAFDAAGAANTAEGNAKNYTDGQIQLLDAEVEVVGINDGSYVTAVAQTDGKIQVSTVEFDAALNGDSTNAVQNKVVNTAIEGIKTNLGGLKDKQIANVPESCAAGGTGTCSLVMKNGVATWEVVEY